MMPRWPLTEDERFWSKVDKTATCWLWTGYRGGGANAYGRFKVRGKNVSAHRWSYERFRDPIPHGMTIDHLCGTPLCVNPAHLQAVSFRTNVLRSGNRAAINNRKTHCKRGHEFTPDQTYVNPDGQRECRPCRAAARRPRVRA